jgi:AraC-like DNA-binding protein
MLAQAVGSYLERPVDRSLRDHFACVWVHRLPEASATSLVVIPDAAIDLQWIDHRWRVAGPDRDPKTELLAAGSMVVGFRFQPGSAPTWLNAAASDFCNERVWLDEVLSPAALRSDEAIEASGLEQTINALESVLARRAAFIGLPDPDMLAAHRLLSKGSPPGTHLVPWLMAALGWSERTLRRRFEAAFGYGPKTLDRILRFQRYLKLARNRSGDSTADLAAEAGYADQPHLVRECRRLSLCTPSQIPSAVRAGRGPVAER